MAAVIPVEPAAEPPDFDEEVRRPGRRAIARYRPEPPVPASFWNGRIYWRKALPSLYESYGGVCAYVGTRIERVTGSRSVEHFKPKSRYPDLAYEWSNLRLVCGIMNGRKGDYEDVLDPFAIPDKTFDLNALSGEILIHHDCPAGLRALARSTIDRLRLNDGECRKLRQEHADRCLDLWSAQEAERNSPFVYRRLREQGLL